MGKSQKEDQNIEIWADLVRIKDLIIAIIICVTLTLGAYFLAPDKPPMPLFFGLGGAFIGFIIACIVIKPKRELREEVEKDI